MIRIDMIRRDPWHPDKSQRGHSRAWCEVAGRRYEAEGPAPIYKLLTLLWLHGHEGERFEVWSDVSLTGRPGGLAMTGQVRNWARLANGNLSFERKAAAKPDFTPAQRETVTRAAGQIVDLPQRVPLSGEQARTDIARLSGSPEHLQGKDGASTGVATRPAPMAGKVRRRRNLVSGKLRGPSEGESRRSAPLLPHQTPGKVQGYGPLPDVIDMPLIPGWLRRRRDRKAA